MYDFLSRLFGLNTLKQRLRFWVGSTIISLGILILLSTYFTEVYSRTRETNQQLRDIISLQQLYIERWLVDHSSRINFLAASLSGIQPTVDQIEHAINSFVSAHDDFAAFAAIVYVDSQGITLVDTAGPVGNDLSDREYFQQARLGRAYTTELMQARNTRRPIIVVSAPVNDEAGNFNGLVFGAITLEAIDVLMSRFDMDYASETYLLEASGLFITNHPHEHMASVEPLSVRNESLIYSQAVNGVISDSAYMNYANEKVIGQYSWTKEGQWLIVAEMKYELVFQSLYINMLLMAGILLTVFIVTFMLTFILTKGVERPLQLLLMGTNIMREGNYDYRISEEEIASAPTELQQLCDTFNATSQKLKSTIQMLEQTAIADQLTELYNRRFILSEGQRVLETCIRANQPCTALMIDIDYFKKVNDTYGHLVGDRVIIFAASILMASIRSCDMVSRYGGEEFLILAPNTDAEAGGLQIGERIRAFFEDNPYQEGDIELSLTVSIGAADYRKQPSYGTTFLEDMISRADQALYRAKRNGRNRVEILPGSDNKYEEGGELKYD